MSLWVSVPLHKSVGYGREFRSSDTDPYRAGVLGEPGLGGKSGIVSHGLPSPDYDTYSLTPVCLCMTVESRGTTAHTISLTVKALEYDVCQSRQKYGTQEGCTGPQSCLTLWPYCMNRRLPVFAGLRGFLQKCLVQGVMLCEQLRGQKRKKGGGKESRFHPASLPSVYGNPSREMLGLEGELQADGSAEEKPVQGRHSMTSALHREEGVEINRSSSRVVKQSAVSRGDFRPAHGECEMRRDVAETTWKADRPEILIRPPLVAQT